MSIDAQTVTKIAKLARIRITDEERAHFTGELNAILHWVEQLQSVDTEGVPQMTSVADMALPWRKDAVTDGNKQADILANAPAKEYGCFAVPKVIDQG